MAVVVRVRAYAGLWALIGSLGAVLVFAAAAAGPVGRSVADSALRDLMAGAPWTVRDLTAIEPAAAGVVATGTAAAPTTAEGTRDHVEGLLPPALAEVVEMSWGYQHTTIRPPSTAAAPVALSLTGDGITDQPAGLMPLVTLHHQTGLADQLTMVAGRPPGNRAAGGALQVMASVEVAGALGLRVGETYRLLPGVAALTHASGREPVARVPVTVTGVFAPVDAADPVWEPAPRLLRAGPRPWPDGSGATTRLLQATLVTDQGGIGSLLAAGLDEQLETQSVARVRLDTDRLDAGWVDPAVAAVARLATEPGLRPELRVETGLAGLLDEFREQAAAARAVATVVATGLIGTGAGLLLLAARLAVERRRAELALLRARGGSLSTMVVRSAGEAALVVLPAALAGWLLHLLVPGRAGDAPVPGPAVLVVAGLAVLAVPAAVLVVGRRRSWRPPRADLTRHRSAPARLTAELLVILLAGLGVVLIQRRGAGQVGTDPYLSAAPVLAGLAAGLVVLRCYPLPLRVLGALAARWLGAVGFLGLARAGRSATASLLPLLMLVLAVAVGGFTGSVYSSVTAARDAAAVRAVGADARIEAAGLTDRSVAAVAEVAGVEAVAAVGRTGFVRIGGRVDQDARVVAIDAPAYQRILASIGSPARLPDALVAARPGAGPLPVLGPAGLDPDRSLSVEIGGVEYPAEVVGDVADLPALHSRRSWVLVPRQALTAPSMVEEIALAGDADLGAVVHAAGADPQEAAVTSLADHRADLEHSGFNRGLTLGLVIGVAGAALGGLIAIGLGLVAHASARGRTLSLLRTMGLAGRQGRLLMLIELVPATALAVAAGAATGIALPGLLAPGLNLSGFTGGVPVAAGVDPLAVSLLGALFGVFVVGALLAESMINRRLGLGHVLRVE